MKKVKLPTEFVEEAKDKTNADTFRKGFEKCYQEYKFCRVLPYDTHYKKLEKYGLQKTEVKVFDKHHAFIDRNRPDNHNRLFGYYWTIAMATDDIGVLSKLELAEKILDPFKREREYGFKSFLTDEEVYRILSFFNREKTAYLEQQTTLHFDELKEKAKLKGWKSYRDFWKERDGDTWKVKSR